MRYLFYLVHPAKYQFHKIQINELKKHGHTVDIIINTKDILEDLVREEGWEYVNIFPNSRKIKGVHVYIAAGISLLLSIFRLWKYARGKKYDLFIGDALTYLGRIKGIPSLYPTDDVLAAVPEQRTWFIPANYIIAPCITNVGKYEKKMIAYKGYKALAHLHPNHFTPDESKLPVYLREAAPFFLIRCTGFGATHDINKSGISDKMLFSLKEILEPHGKILITSERKLPEELEKYRLNIKKNDIVHYIAFAQLFIGDSTTMSTEAAVLGTPSIEFDEYFYEIDQMIELEVKYGLVHCFRTNQQKEFFEKVGGLLTTKGIKDEYSKKRQCLLDDTIDVSGFLIWFYENYPESVNRYLENPDFQYSFR
jgi:predicted glycosyltransferase